MKVTNDINKLVWARITHVSDVVCKTLTDAAVNGTVQIDRSTLTKLLAIVGSTIEQGYHESNRAFEKNLSKVLDEHVASVTAETSQEQSSKTSKKK